VRFAQRAVAVAAYTHTPSVSFDLTRCRLGARNVEKQTKPKKMHPPIVLVAAAAGAVAAAGAAAAAAAADKLQARAFGQGQLMNCAVAEL
jgi:hypothetical protein